MIWNPESLVRSDDRIHGHYKPLNRKVDKLEAGFGLVSNRVIDWSRYVSDPGAESSFQS